MKRIEWVDTLKGIGIILMVLGHYPAFSYTGRALTLIYSFHMPLFLFVGGYLFSDSKDLAGKLKSNVRSLAVPYFGFSIISLIFSWPVNEQIASNYLYGIFYGIGTENMPNVPLWFFTFYFTGRCIFAIIVYLANAIGKNKRVVKEWVLFFLTFAIISVAYVYRLKYYKPRLPWNPDMSALCMGFYYMGYQFRRFKPKRELPIMGKVIICGLAFALWVPAALYGTRVDINASYFGKGMWCFYFTASLGLVWCVGLAHLLSRMKLVSRLINYLGENSLYVVGFHIPMNFIVGAVILPFMPVAVQAAYMTKSVIGVLFTVISTMLLSLMAGYLWREGKKSLISG